MIPKVKFVYSFPYDSRFRDTKIMKEFLEKRGETYPTPLQIKKFTKKIEKIWNQKEERVLKEMTKISKLKWNEELIKCYVVGIARGLSSPLTMKITKTSTEFIDTLIHELIHNLQSQSTKDLKKWFEYLNKEYPGEHPKTIKHIFLHAIHHELCLSVFNKKRLKEIIKSESTPNYKGRITSQEIGFYKNSWKIVLKETPEAIIKKFHEVTK